MDFDWMNVELPADLVRRNAQKRAAMAQEDVYLRAAMLRRLGFDAAYVKHRLLGNQAWAWDVIPGSPALSQKALKEQVDAAFAR
jgi:hypothetical protein